MEGIENSLFKHPPNTLRIELCLKSKVECQVNNLIVIQIWNDLDELLCHIYLLHIILKEELFQIRFIWYLPWWEELICHERLATTYLLPMLLMLLHSPHLRWIDALKWLTPWVL